MAREPEPADPRPDAAGSGSTVVYFDGTCPLCSVEVGYYARLAEDDRLRLVDASEGAEGLGGNLTQAEAMARLHVRLSDGSLVSGARAVVAIWDTLPRWRWAARIARLPGVMAVLELGYRLFLPVRPFFSGLAARLGARPANPTR